MQFAGESYLFASHNNRTCYCVDCSFCLYSCVKSRVQFAEQEAKCKGNQFEICFSPLCLRVVGRVKRNNLLKRRVDYLFVVSFSAVVCLFLTLTPAFS